MGSRGESTGFDSYRGSTLTLIKGSHSLLSPLPAPGLGGLPSPKLLRNKPPGFYPKRFFPDLQVFFL